MTPPVFLIDPFPRRREMILDDAAWTELESLGRIVSHFGAPMADADVDAVLPEATIIIGQTALPPELLAKAETLQAVINVKGNWEPNIDYQGCQRRGIWVLSIAPAMAPAVAEACLGFAIDLGRGTLAADRAFRAGTERYGIAGNQDSYSLYDADVGFVGFGNLGRALRPLLTPFGCRVSVYDPWLSPGYLQSQDCRAATLDEVLGRSRYLFILAGATTQNEGFLDRAALATIAPDTSVILASRSEVVDFEGFVDLAEAGHFRAAIDVFPEEPVASDDRLRNSTSIVLSSHRAGGIWASYGRICDMMMDDIRQILAGHPPMRLQRADPRQAPMMRSR